MVVYLKDFVLCIAYAGSLSFDERGRVGRTYLERRLAIRLHNNREKDKIKSRICKNGNIIHYYEHTMEKEKLKRIILGPLCNNEARA